MQSINKRLSDLENAQPPSEAMTIIRRMVAPGQLDAEIDYIHDAHGNERKRLAGETEAAFTDRAASETPPNAWGFKTLIGHSHDFNNQTP